MADKWIINSAKTVGRSHIRENIPCQDSVESLQKNGVSVIALSDGCGSAPLSHYGSNITVKALCDVFVNNYDDLYNSDDNKIRNTVVMAIVERLRDFITDNPKIVSDFKRDNPQHYEKFKNNWPGFTQIEKLYPLTLFDATVQFVAVKDDKIIAGRLGDGVIADIRNGALRILSSEDKVGVESNATWYPSTVLIASENKAINPWSKFEILKGGNSYEYGMFLIMSDGVAEVEEVYGEEEDGKEKFLYPYEIQNLLVHSDSLLKILEEQYKPSRGVYDDLSVIIMQKPVVKIEKMILRQYDDRGRTIDNSKVHVIDDIDVIKTVYAEDDEFSLNLFDNNVNKMIDDYFGDTEYRSYFTEQASKVLRYLEEGGSPKIEDVFDFLQPYVDNCDWMQMLIYFKMFDLFTVDSMTGTIKRKDS